MESSRPGWTLGKNASGVLGGAIQCFRYAAKDTELEPAAAFSARASHHTAPYLSGPGAPFLATFARNGDFLAWIRSPTDLAASLA
jgi:hypothetical protein